MALGLLHEDEHPVNPAKLNQAGYDGIMTFQGRKKMRISIKRYGASVRQKEFEKNAIDTEKYIINNHGFKRFMLRGKEKVQIETGLLALAQPTPQNFIDKNCS